MTDEPLPAGQPNSVAAGAGSAVRYFVRSAFLSSLPTLVRSSASTNRTLSGMANFDTVPLSTALPTWARISSAVAAEPGISTMSASGRSPHFSLGMPMTAT